MLSASDPVPLQQLAIPPVVSKTLALPSRTLEPGGTLYRAGEEASSLYFVSHGVLKGVVPSIRVHDRIADLYGSGDILGVTAIEGGRHAETLIAVHLARVTPLDPRIAMNDRKLSKYIACTLARQLRRYRAQLGDSRLPVGARVTRALLRLAERFGRPAAVGDWVDLPLAVTHEEVASLTGSMRVTVTRIVGELRRDGVLTGTRGGTPFIPKDSWQPLTASYCRSFNQGPMSTAKP